MKAAVQPQSGGRLLVDALRQEGVDRIFCLPGESFLPILDALFDTPEIELVVCRHEGAAAFMAEADGKLTGRPGICLVTRGPGATHASIGLHTAFQDSTPLVLLVGQVPRAFTGREAFQEIDYRRWLRPLVKEVMRVSDPRRIVAAVSRAFAVATTGRPGPVVLELPEDVLREEAVSRQRVPTPATVAPPGAAALTRLGHLLHGARRPLLILGGGGWTDGAVRDIAVFAEAHGLPVVASFRRQYLFDNAHPHYVGHLGTGPSPALVRQVRAADLLIAVGTRLGEITTGGYDVIVPPRPAAKLIHVHADAAEIGRVFQPTLGIASPAPVIAAALRKLPAVCPPSRRRRTARLRAEFEAFSRLPKRRRGEPFTMTDVMAVVEPRLPDDAIVTNGAGNFTVWVHRYHCYRRFRTQLAPTNGAMGYGVPAAIAAQRRHPGRRVICFAGDGDFMIYPQELSTAVQLRLPIVFVVINNRMLGTIRMHQERRYPGRAYGTDLINPDFAALARSLGAWGKSASDRAAFAAAFGQAWAQAGPSVIEARVDPAQLTPTSRLNETVAT